VLRVEPAKPRRDDDSKFECVAENGVGDPASASANLVVYPEGQGNHARTLIPIVCFSSTAFASVPLIIGRQLVELCVFLATCH